MKFKFVLVPLVVFGLVVGVYADCNKEEVFKLIDKGFSKADIDTLCETSEIKEEKSKWITPTQKVCEANGGKVDNDEGICEATWDEAKDICLDSGGKLPSKYELSEIIDDCGGQYDIFNQNDYHNDDNPSYQACYKEKGFSGSSSYWSSSMMKNPLNGGFYTYSVDFLKGFIKTFYRSNPLYIRCLRDEE